MLRIGLCDDQPDARDALRIQLERVMREDEEEIVYEFSTGAGAVRWLKKHPGEIDLLFLDVEMPGVSGMEAAGQIREFDKEICLVFVTGYTDYVFDGYQVNALDYVIKPASAERLAQVLRRVRVQIYEKRDRTYCFKNSDGTYRFALSGISYFYSDKRKVALVSGAGGEFMEYTFYGKLDQVEEQLSGAFVRIHQRYLVNPQRVEMIGKDYVCMGTEGPGYERRLPISRAMKESAVAKLAKAMMEGAWS